MSMGRQSSLNLNYDRESWLRNYRLTCIREVPGLYLIWESDYPD
jgi:hypothetical protein